MSDVTSDDRVREWAAAKPWHPRPSAATTTRAHAALFNDKIALAREVLALRAELAEAVAVAREAVRLYENEVWDIEKEDHVSPRAKARVEAFDARLAALTSSDAPDPSAGSPQGDAPTSPP